MTTTVLEADPTQELERRRAAQRAAQFEAADARRAVADMPGEDRRDALETINAGEREQLLLAASGVEKPELVKE